MHVALSNLAIISVTLLLIAIALQTWIEVVRRRWQAVPIIPVEPRRPVPWTATEIALILAGYFFFQVAAVSMFVGFVGLEREHATEHHTSSKGDAEPKEAEPEEADVNPVRVLEIIAGEIAASAIASCMAA